MRSLDAPGYSLGKGDLGGPQFPVFQNDLINITPSPVLARLERPHDRMPGGMEMLGGMPVLRGITAAHMPAGKTKPKMDPGIAHFQAFLAAFGFLLDGLDFLAM